MEERLNDMQRSFCEYYLESGNATLSARKAGYSERTSYAIGHQLLKNPKVRNFLEERRNEIKKELQDRFLHDALVARQVMYKIMTDENASDRDRLMACKDFLDRSGFTPTTKQEITGTNGGAIQIVFREPE